MISQLELASNKMKKSGVHVFESLDVCGEGFRVAGMCAQWFAECDEIIKKVSEGVNGQLFATLLQAKDYPDPECAELFRKGMGIMSQALSVQHICYMTVVCHRCQNGGGA